ncbi:hypothetical protein MLD38_017326 [Melastoma candidum]|uniref:Uncharacterized protein n=1 Tax=Melastoma candidum TaxID=119954 RepID=A0ACB9QYH3_9MYRT|nr:hypothetical protein MLD38_017326 [Melastoma candidum]
MSGLINSSLNGNASNLPESTGRSFNASFSGQPGTMQGLHNMHGSYNIPNMAGTLGSRNSVLNNIPSGAVQQPTGSLPGGRFTSNNLPAALSQLSHGSGVPNRGITVVGNHGFGSSTNGVGGSIPGILPTSAAVGNRNSVAGLGISPILGNTGPRITNSMGNLIGGNMGRTINTGLSVPGLSSRLNLAANTGSANLGIPGQNRLMGGVGPQGSSQVASMLGNSYPSGGGALSQNHVQAVNSLSSMGMLNDVNSNDSTPFDINLDFPQLTSRPSSAGGPQGQLGSLRKQIPSMVQQNQEFSIQNEDFPALPGFKGSSADYATELHQKDQIHDNPMSLMQSQHFSMGRSTGFNLGGTYASHRPQQQQQHAPSGSSSGISFPSVNSQELLQFHGSDIFSSPLSTYHSQTGGPPGLGLRPLISPNSVSDVGSYDQLMPQYQQSQNPSQFRLQQLSAVNQSLRDHGMKSMQVSPSPPDPFGLLALLNVIVRRDPLALGIDLTTLGLDLNSAEDLHKTFSSPWSDEPAKDDPEFTVPECYYAKPPPTLHPGFFAKFNDNVLFYIFYSMPRDEAQILAAMELSKRGWVYHKELRLWLVRIPNVEPLVKTSTYERASYLCFDAVNFKILRKDNFVLHYDMLEEKPTLPQH